MPAMQSHDCGYALMLRKGMMTAKSQIFAMLYAGEDGTNLSLAAAVGCTPATVKRYREEWNGLQARELEPLPTYHHGNADPYHALVCAVLTRAVRDYDLWKVCDKRTCRFGEYHRCQAEAGQFLTGWFAEYLFDHVKSVSQEEMLETRGLGAPREADSA
jgi:hypothetical protein